MKLTDLAAALALSPSAVSRLAARGMPTETVEAAAAWRGSHVRPRLKSDGSPGRSRAPGKSVEDYQASRARREAAEATEAELRVAKTVGTLVDRDLVHSVVFEVFRVLRDRAMSAGGNFAAKVFGQTDIGSIEREFQAVIRDAFGDEAAIRKTMAAKRLPLPEKGSALRPSAGVAAAASTPAGR